MAKASKVQMVYGCVVVNVLHVFINFMIAMVVLVKSKFPECVFCKSFILLIISVAFDALIFPSNYSDRCSTTRVSHYITSQRTCPS